MSGLFPHSGRERGDELRKLADYHIQHDLHQSDRDALHSASKTISSWASVGAAVGLGLGLYTAIRLRRSRKVFFDVFRAAEKPTKVVFADGRTEALPDITPMLKPTTLGDFATYFFASAGGLFLGGELGLFGGMAYGCRPLAADAERRQRIENALRSFRVDTLRKEADEVEKGKTVGELF
ncbi:hypothetical protein ASPVEDRAFT_402803 [Aspergillus versicolor CBS 583.65]|uniref:Transmembrane protein n=1 Tax=Aspergillus versicolor CBS 583.65 TaxID=1036611 RepID=A0A1L9Q4G2_ASPVE|nr:uncharacterized protein ASPVEDRAFT_402803 [Aspergillus versicolor CBS 583.65]OJJ08568.1 hypothetical protein ASPVEDRAFT_402803 [Aspergillus versicolor CBS 583.65]